MAYPVHLSTILHWVYVSNNYFLWSWQQRSSHPRPDILRTGSTHLKNNQSSHAAWSDALENSNGHSSAWRPSGQLESISTFDCFHSSTTNTPLVSGEHFSSKSSRVEPYIQYLQLTFLNFWFRFARVERAKEFPARRTWHDRSLCKLMFSFLVFVYAQQKEEKKNAAIKVLRYARFFLRSRQDVIVRVDRTERI